MPGGERWAIVCSLIATAKLNDIEPFAYLRDVLQRMADGHSVKRLDDLLPWNWTPTPVNPRPQCDDRTHTKKQGTGLPTLG
jgi:hypothetical protein